MTRPNSFVNKRRALEWLNSFLHDMEGKHFRIKLSYMMEMQARGWTGSTLVTSTWSVSNGMFCFNGNSVVIDKINHLFDIPIVVLMPILLGEIEVIDQGLNGQVAIIDGKKYKLKLVRE